jgi:hypothetical protein
MEGKIYVIPIGNVPHSGETGELRGTIKDKNGWYLVRFEGGTEEVYDADSLKLAAHTTEDSAR